MIGSEIRSFRHLSRLLGSTTRLAIIKAKERGFVLAEVFNDPNKEYLYIVNTTYGMNINDMYSHLSTFLDSRVLDRLYGYGKIVCYNLTSERELRSANMTFRGIFLLPENFEASYNDFLKQNPKIASDLTHKHLYLQDQTVKILWAMTDASKTFFQWACICLFINGVSIYDLYRIMNWYINFGHLTKNLSKGNIVSYTNKDQIYMLMAELEDIKREKRIADTINLFNTKQKKIFKDGELPEKVKEALSKFARLSSIKRYNFIRKVSDIEDKDTLFHELKLVSSIHFDWSKASLVDYLKNVEGLSYSIVFDNENILLLRVNDYETIKKLAKTTSWCISKNKQYWNNYVHDNARQFVLFDFNKKEDDKLSIIGFTLTANKGITNSHNFRNESLLKEDDYVSEIFFLTNSLICDYLSSDDIYSILSSLNIPLSLLDDSNVCYDWNEKNVLDKLFSYVSSNNVTILSKTDNKCAIMVRDMNFAKFAGKSFIDMFGEQAFYCKFIVFMDFSKAASDQNKILYGLVQTSGETFEDICVILKNYIGREVPTSKFDSLLKEYNLPYDIISRNNDNVKRAYNAIVQYNFKDLREFANNEKILREALGKITKDTIFTVIRTSIKDYFSVEFLKIVYGCGIKLCDVYMRPKEMGFILQDLYRKAESYTSFVNTFDPALVDKVLNKDITNSIDLVKFYSLYIGIEMLIKNEIKDISDNTIGLILSPIAKSIYDRRSHRFGEYMANLILPLVQSNNTFAIKSLCESYLSRYKGEKDGKNGSYFTISSAFSSNFVNDYITPVYRN